MTIDETQLDIGEDYVQLEDKAKVVLFKLEGEQLAKAIDAGEVKPGDLHQSLYTFWQKLRGEAPVPSASFQVNMTTKHGIRWD